MATPFSPFVGRRPAKPVLKRRQSELPSDLIDWEAPEIPELDKQRIIYEDHIKEMNEDYEIETLLNEEIFSIAHDSVVDQYQSKLKDLESEITKEKSRVHLLLSQIKMFESNVKDDEERVNELENEVSNQRIVINELEQQKENWDEEKMSMQNEIENLTFRNNEILCQLNHEVEKFVQKKNEADDFKRKWENVKNQLAYYKKLAKNKGKNEDAD